MGLVHPSPADGAGWRAKYAGACVPRASRGSAFALVVSSVRITRRRHVPLFSFARATGGARRTRLWTRCIYNERHSAQRASESTSRGIHRVRESNGRSPGSFRVTFAAINIDRAIVRSLALPSLRARPPSSHRSLASIEDRALPRAREMDRQTEQRRARDC